MADWNRLKTCDKCGHLCEAPFGRGYYKGHLIIQDLAVCNNCFPESEFITIQRARKIIPANLPPGEFMEWELPTPETFWQKVKRFLTYLSPW